MRATLRKALVRLLLLTLLAAAGTCWAIQPPVVGTPQAKRHVIRVGPHRAVTRIADAMQAARSGDVIEVDAGTYVNDVAVWTQSNLT
ncbi:MAG: hypothetical protein ACREYB_11465, partial [Casimicrobiaceae bacterium]